MGKEYKSAAELMREAEERRASAGLSAGASAKSAEELAIQQERAETEKTKQNINIFQTAIGTLIDTGFNIDKGTLKGLEGIVDFVIGISNAVPVGIDYLCGGDLYEQVRNAIEYDATGKIMGLREDLTSMIYGRTTLESSLYRQNKAGQMVAEVEQAVGQMLPSVVVSIATMGAAAPEAAASLGTTVQGLAKAASLATLGVSAAGTSTEAAYQDGANFGQGLAYGAVSGGIEVATEKMFGGVTSAIYGKGMLPKVVPTIANKGFVRVGRELLEEGVEEVVSELASPIAKTIYKGGAALDEYSTADYWKGVGKSFAMGAATSALYTGTVGYGVAKATGGAVGKEADIEGLLEDAEKLAQKRESVFYSYKYDRNTDARIGDQIARRYQEISKILVKMDADKRSAAIEKFSLGKAMAEDGQINADFAAKLGIRTPGKDSTGGMNAAPGANLGQYASPGVDASAAEAAASYMGLSVFDGELTGESRANYRDFLKTARNLNRQTGGRFNFVLVNGSGVDGSQVKGAYVRQGDLVLINTDTLADSGKTADALYENWFGVTVEEAMHLANNTDEALRRDAYSSLAQLLSEDEELVSKVSRELVEDGYFTEEQVKKFMTADSLTEDETQAANVFFDELFAHMARHELSTKHFFQRLAKRDRSALERFLQALKQSIKATASGKGKTAQGLTKRAQAAERLFMEAMAEAGFKVTEDGKIIGVNDEEEKEDQETAKTEVRYSLKGKTFTITEEDVQNIRKMGRKSVNDFTSQEIRECEPWARKFYEELKEKSPFFRAWFGDWRAYDKTRLTYQEVNNDFVEMEDIPRKECKNEDTGWSISVLRNGIDETIHKKGVGSNEHRSLLNVDAMIENSVLLDTVSVSEPSKRMGMQAIFVHHLYAPIYVGGQKAIAKLYVTESIEGEHKFYLVKIETIDYTHEEIEKEATQAKVPTDESVLNPRTNSTAGDASSISIAEIFDFVKRNGGKFESGSKNPVYFNPKPVNPAFLNEDGTPKVFYHGTRAENGDFYVFDYSKAVKRGGLGLKALGKGNYFTTVKLNGTERYGSRVIEVYLSIHNPFVVEEGLFEDSVAMKFGDDARKWSTDRIQEEMRKAGFDGVIKEHNGNMIAVAFDSNQIKSATDNIGTFDRANPDIRYSKKAAKRDEVTLTPEEAAREDTPFGRAVRRMLEEEGETRESRESRESRAESETDDETADERMDEIGEDVRLNRYDKTWTYGRAEAEKAIDALLETLGGGDGNKYLTRGKLSVKLKMQDRRELTDKMFEALNTATTNEQLRNAAEEIARAVYDKAVVTTVWAQDVGYIKDVTDKMKLYKSFLGRIDMSGIKSNQIDMKVIRRWEKGRKAETKGTLTIDNVKKILEKEGLSFREGLSDSAFIVELNREYERHRIAAQAMLNGIQRIIEEPNQDWIDKMTKSVLEVAAKEGKYRSVAEMMASIDKAEHDLDVRKDSVEKLAEKTQEEIISNRLMNQAKYIVEGIRHWKSGEFQAAAEKSNSDILKGTLGKLSKIYYRGNLAVDPTKRVMRELHDWYITQEAKDFLGESFWNQDIAAHMESIASVKGRIDSENLKKLCDVLQYMKHAIENFHTVEINGKRVDAAPVAKAYREKAMKSGREIKKETWFGRIFRAYIVNYRDPESLARYFDNYVEGGFLTDMLHNLREGELKAEVIEDSMVSQIEEFSKTHKKYFDNLEKRTIRVGSTEIPAGEALDIYLLLKRKQAVIHLMKSGYRYTSGDGMTERESGFMVTDKDTTEQEMMERAETEAAAIFEQMTEADKDFVNLASKIFNEDCKKFKRETDLFMLGFSNVLDDFYIPIRISDKAIKADDGVYQDELDRVSNASFNKSITEGAKNKIVVENLQTVLLRHIRGISKYAGLARTISEFETLVNMNLSGNSGDIVSIATAYEKIWPDEGKLNGGAIKYLKDMISDVQKLSRDAGNTGLMTAMVEKVRGRAAVAVLGLNPKVVATQFSSLFAATSIIPPKYIIQALYTRAKHGEAGDYSDLARLRNKENVAIRAMTLDDRVGAIGEKAMFAIGKTDEFVVHTVWKACKLMVRDQVGASVSQEAVNTQAGQLLTQVIYETQQNAQSTERSRAMRSNSPLEKIVTMFSADAMKVFGRVMDGVGELRARMARKESPARIAESKRKLGRSVSAMVSSAVYYAIISMLFRKFLARDDDDSLKEWSEADILEFLGDMAGSMMGGLPIIKDIYEFLVSGFSPEDMGLGALTDMMEGVKSLGLVVGQGFTGQATDEEWFSAIRKLMYAGGTVCGIPIANTIKYTRGLVNLFSDDTVYRYDALHAVPAYSSDIAKAVENGDEEMVRTVVGVMLDKNVGAVTSSPVRRELARLASAGQTVIPQAVGTSITYDGEAYQMNQRERRAFSSVYGQASAEAAQMISMASYQAMDDKVKAKALKRLYQFYYNMAMEEVLGVDIEGRAQLVSKVIDPLKLALIVAEAGELAADIGADGKAVAGSKKMKVAQYIAKLKLTEAQKFIVYAYLGYSVSGGEQTIRAYVMAQDLERGEKEELLEMCGGGY